MRFLLGFTDEVIQQVKSLPSTSEIEQNGHDFRVTITTGPSVLENEFTIGKETEMQTATGEKIKVRQDSKVCCLLWSAVGSSCVSSSANLHSCFMFEDGG